jgi:gluconate 5-dehydrogenase
MRRRRALYDPRVSTQLFDLTGRVALVTGSSQGIGLTIAGGLARSGARVVLNGRSEARLAGPLAALRAAGHDAHAVAFDVTRPDEVEAAVARIEAQIGAIEILVNNAGIQVRGPLETVTIEDWRALIDTDLTSVFVVGRAVGVRMAARGHGKIINICSMQSELGRPTIGPYTAAKGGVKMLTKAMCAEWAPKGVQVNGLGPGYFATEMTRKLRDDPEFDAWLRKRTPAGRWGEPEELIGAAVFLASAASNYVNGHILYVDGGMLAAV